MKKKDKPVWAKNIIKRRKEAGYSSGEDFAEAIDIPYPTYRDIEAGTSEGRYETRQIIAQALKCGVADFYLENERPVELAHLSQVGRLLSTLSMRPPALQRLVMALVYADPSLAEEPLRPALAQALHIVLKE